MGHDCGSRKGPWRMTKTEYSLNKVHIYQVKNVPGLEKMSLILGCPLIKMC